MTRWKLYRERRLRKEKALQLLILSCTVRPADREPCYRYMSSKAGFGVPSSGSDNRSQDAALTEPDEACCAVGLEALRASSHQRSYGVIPFAVSMSQPSPSPQSSGPWPIMGTSTIGTVSAADSDSTHSKM